MRLLRRRVWMEKKEVSRTARVIPAFKDRREEGDQGSVIFFSVVKRKKCFHR